MIVDAHTHACPDRVARSVEAVMRARFGPLYGEMTVSALLASMERWGVDVSVVFNVAEKPAVVRPSNDFIIGLSGHKRLITMGSIHPDFEDYPAEIKRLRKNGVRGVKFHSLVQNLRIDEDRMLRIYPHLGEDMIACFHCGAHPLKPSAPVIATPESVARVLDTFPKLKVVAAHMGGLRMLDEAKKWLVGRNVYLDTSWTPGFDEVDPQLAAALITEHGVERVLFATDYPMADLGRQLEAVRRLPLSEEDKRRILGENARELFRIEGG